jgi:hypothetical protein
MKGHAQSLKQMYGKPNCWEKLTTPLVRFWTGDGDCWGPLLCGRGNAMPEQERLLIYFALGTVIVFGPKAHEFYDDFANHRATGLKADAKEILSVEIDLNRKSE